MRKSQADALDLYTPALGQSPLLDEMMEKLQSRINRELKFHEDLMMLRGALDMTLAQVRFVFLLVDIGWGLIVGCA